MITLIFSHKMFTVRMIIVSIVVLGGVWFSYGCTNETESLQVWETFAFIENSTYSVKNSGDEVLFRAHFSTRLRSSGERRFVIYFIDPSTSAATVLKNCSLGPIIGYGLIEETLSIKKDGVLLLKISLHSSDEMLDSLFALTMVNVIQSSPPLTKKELKKASIIRRSLPYMHWSQRKIIFPDNGLELKTLQLFESVQDGIMQNLNYAILSYNGHLLSNEDGLPIDVSAYNRNGSANSLKGASGFLFLTFKNVEGLYITYIHKWYHFVYFQLLDRKNGSGSFPFPKLYPMKNHRFFPLENYERKQIDFNKEYFFNVQSMRRNLYKRKGFAALQGCGEGEFIPIDHNNEIVWAVVKSGTKRMVDTDTWTYEIGGRNVSALAKKDEIPVTLKCAAKIVCPLRDI